MAETGASGEVVVQIEGASRIYQRGENAVRAMDEVSLTIRRGEFLALVGPSGSGKSTVLNCIGCLDTPTAGSIRIEGREVVGLSKKERGLIRASRLGFIFQSFNLIPVMTAFENIEFSLHVEGKRSRDEARRRVNDMLERLGIANQADKLPSEMSGGQQQRVAIGRALVKEPALVLADEPTANLDTKTSADIIALMGRMNQETNTTFVFSTHDHQLMRHARRIVKITDGRIVGDSIQSAPAPDDAAGQGG